MSEPYDGWDEFTISAFKDDMESMGIYVDKVLYTGFCSQGDGACFNGLVMDWEKFIPSVLGENKSDPGLTQLVAAARDDGWAFSVSHKGHYYHEYCTDFEVDLSSFGGWASSSASDYVLHNYLEEKFTEFFREQMRKVYRQLEADYWAIVLEADLIELTQLGETK